MSQFNNEQLKLIKEMKSVHNLKDRTLNIFKLMIYQWDINKAVKYYHNDEFCIDHFLDQCKRIPPNNNSDILDTIATDGIDSDMNDGKDICKYKHKYNFYSLWNVDYNSQLSKLICEYLFYRGNYQYNANLYCFYGHLLRMRIKTEKEARQVEQLYIKAISLNPKFADAHSGYAFLLQKSGYQGVYDLEKAYKHCEISCSIESDPNVHIFCINYCNVLLNAPNIDNSILEKALFYAEKGLKYKENNRSLLGRAGEILFDMKKYSQCIEYYDKAFNASNAYSRAGQDTKKYIVAKKYILKNKTIANINKKEKKEKVFAKVQRDRERMEKWKICYFDEIESHRNSSCLTTMQGVRDLVNGYIRSNSDDKYYFGMISGIVMKYFGSTRNECVFMCVANNKIEMNNDSGHVYRTIVFDWIELNKNLVDREEIINNYKSNINVGSFTKMVKLKIIESKMCDYFLQTQSFLKLHFGFDIGVICIDPSINNNINVDDCQDKEKEKEKAKDKDKDKNPFNLNRNMNICISDLIALSDQVKFVSGAHFALSDDDSNNSSKNSNENKNNEKNNQAKFIWETRYDSDSTIHLDIDYDCGKKLGSQTWIDSCAGCDTIQFGIKCVFHKEDSYDLMDLFQQNDDDNVLMKISVIGKFNDIEHVLGEQYCCLSKLSKYKWFPAVSCVSCNCKQLRNQGLILSVIYD